MTNTVSFNRLLNSKLCLLDGWDFILEFGGTLFDVVVNPIWYLVDLEFVLLNFGFGLAGFGFGLAGFGLAEGFNIWIPFSCFLMQEVNAYPFKQDIYK